MITLPKEWKIYSNSIRDRCKDLIEYKIWSGIDLTQFELWRHNFKTDKEKYFCACLLDSLIYRSNQQTYSLINQMLQMNLNNLFRMLGETALQDFPDCLVERYKDPMIRLVSVNTTYDPVTKSSNEVLRFMKRYFHINERWIINPWNIEDAVKRGIKAFIFVDDFLGTGHQFEEVILDSNIGDLIHKNLIVYAALVAHTEGISYLNKNYPNLKFSFSEKLDKPSHSFFSNYFYDEPDVAKSFYIDLLNQRGIPISSGNEFGYGNLELTFAFEHAAPDNSLQLLHARNDNWSPLFNR
jgi:hypothetical protein